jgi:LPXTG-site transpeptidase (sortase) family protein
VSSRRPAAVGAAATTLALLLAADGCSWSGAGRLVAVAPPALGEARVDATLATRVAPRPARLSLRPAFTAVAAWHGTPAVTPAPLVPRVPTHGIVLDELAPATVVAPVAIRIPAHDVSSTVVPVGVDEGTGELSVPADPAQVGWYQFGATPGSAGAAVLAGHVDWKGRPGAFLHLDRVQTGERVEIDLGDGTTHAFVVIETHVIAKTELPADLFARTGPSTLVLITCGGEFDRSIHRYKQNVVVVATLTA